MAYMRPRSLRAGLALGLGLALAACAQDSGTRWKTPGANVSSVDLARTKEQCASTSQAYGFTTLGDLGVAPRRPRLPGALDTRSAETRRQADLYRLCMNDRGYKRLGRADEADEGD